MNGVRIGLATIVLGLGGMSFGMKSLLAGEPCAPTSYTLQPPELHCYGECSSGGKCDPVSSLIPGKPPITCWVCMCGAAGTSTLGPVDCFFALFVSSASVTPACVPKKCTGNCGSPSFDVARGAWVCKCAK